MKGMTFSLLSGLLAALASLCGKFSMAADETAYLCEVVSSNWLSEISSHYFCENVSLLSTCNGLGVRLQIVFF